MKAILQERLDIAYHNLRLSSLLLMISVTALFLVLYDHVPGKLLILWYICVLVVSALRFLSYMIYSKQHTRYTLQQWKKIFYIGTVSSSVLLGMAPFIFFLPDQPAYQMVLLLVLAGVTAGGTASFSSFPTIVRLQQIIILVPLFLVMILQEDFIYHVVAFLIFLYLLILLSVSKIVYQSFMSSIRARKQYEREKEKLLMSQERFGTVFKQAPLGIFMYDTHLVIQEVNDEFIEFIEAPKEYLLGLDLHQLKDERVVPSISAITQGVEGFYEGEYTTKYKRKNLWITMHTAPLKNMSGEVIGGIGIISDITQRMLTQISYEHQAKYDALTNIPNRSFLLEKIAEEIARFRRHGRFFAVLFLDLDHFKNINDSLGHAVGDKLLIKTAQRLRKVIREEDTLARLGGDEFVILLPDLDTDENSAAMKAETIVQKVHATLVSPFSINKHVLSVSSSIGVALVSDKESVDDILKHADIAMYEAKKAGRNTTKFYQKEMDAWVNRRIRIENGLRAALKNNEFEIHYQPIVTLETSQIIGAEALLRWHSSTVSDVYPDEFIPIAEESGLIFGIGAWVLKHALQQFVVWQKQFKELPAFNKIAVNISAYQFDNARCVNQIGSIIKASKINPACLDLELVESALVENIQRVRAKMQEFRDLGVGISIDDFGTGYSSLSYLKKLPFTKLKIDKSFTMDIQNDADDKELISTILMIADTFDFEVVAEGVETYEQYAFLKEKQCQYMQGYFCSKPLSAADFEALLKKDNGKCIMDLV